MTPTPTEIEMSLFRRMLGLPEPSPAAAGIVPPPGSPAETATVRRIVAEVNALPPERARILAAAAYVLTRVANADMVVSDEEIAYIEQTLTEESGLTQAEAVIVVEVARQQARLFGSTEDYLVTREYLGVSTPKERLELLRACFMAAAADDQITAAESATLDQIANELQIEAHDLSALRAEFSERFTAVQALRAAKQA